MNPYRDFITAYARDYAAAQRTPMGGFAPLAKPTVAPSAPNVLIFSPHPDDECIIGALPLRLLRQSGMRVINVAVTQGSKKERQAARWAELQQACGFIGFDLIQTREGGLERVNAQTREQDPTFWAESVGIIRGILARTRPTVIFFPHEHDWNSSHIGTHWLVRDALTALGPSAACYTVETEFWGQNHLPNLMVESTPEEVADLVAGTSFHIGEVTRNPFHLFLPAWMQDNVRRGSELVGGQGEAAPKWTFATLYRLRRWDGSILREISPKGRLLPAGENPFVLFP
jgi:N-acetylglucosamine malate deacetylase 1